MKASFWTVRFETKNGMFHPVYYGQPGGPKVTKETVRVLAEKYLSENSDWLVGIDEIYSPEQIEKGVQK